MWQGCVPRLLRQPFDLLSYACILEIIWRRKHRAEVSSCTVIVQTCWFSVQLGSNLQTKVILCLSPVWHTILISYHDGLLCWRPAFEKVCNIWRVLGSKSLYRTVTYHKHVPHPFWMESPLDRGTFIHSWPGIFFEKVIAVFFHIAAVTACCHSRAPWILACNSSTINILTAYAEEYAAVAAEIDTCCPSNMIIVNKIPSCLSLVLYLQNAAGIDVRGQGQDWHFSGTTQWLSRCWSSTTHISWSADIQVNTYHKWGRCEWAIPALGEHRP